MVLPRMAMDRGWMCTLCVLACLSVHFVKGGEDMTGCNVHANLDTDPHPEIAETARNVEAEWVAKDTILVVASSPDSSTNVWLGSKLSSGLFRFTKHKDTISEEIQPDTLKVSPSGLKIAVMMTHNSKKLYVSSNGGASWISHTLPDTPFSSKGILMSEVNPSHIVLTADNGDLYVSLNLGEEWKRLARDVALASFAKESDKMEYLFYSAKQSDSPAFDLYRVDLAHTSPKKILSGMYRFFVDTKYMFVSKKNYTSSGNIFFNPSRRFYVSTNYFGLKPTFAEVQLPSAKWNHHVQVMATHESGAFIHISTTENDRGTLYVSDNSGVRFIVSLENHLFKRFAVFGSSISFNDFYEVNSLRGVYITVNVSYHNNNTAYHSSVITFNNGATWQLLNPPSTADCFLSKGCSVHLHATYSTLQSYALANATLKNGPLSASNAPGIIVAQASLGKSRDYDPTKSVIVTSQDGGHTWTKPNIPAGQYTYGVADYGNVIAVVQDSEKAEYIWFSHDRGVCFKKEQLDTTNHFKISKGLLMDPQTRSLYAFALGLEGNGDDDAWKLIAINFGSILSSPCHAADYTTTDMGNQCIMGYKQLYTVVKPESVCYTDDYSPIPKNTPCNCTYDDMECEFGYTSQWSNGVLNCTRTSTKRDSLAKECPPGEKYYYQSKSGLRIIAGNKCKNTTETAQLLAYERKICEGHEEDSGMDQNKPASRSGRTAGQVIGAIIIILALMAAAGLTLYCIIKCRKPEKFHDRVVYKKVPLTENGFSDCSDSDDDLLN